MGMSVQCCVSAALVPEKEFAVPLEWEAHMLQAALNIIQISSVLLPLFRFWSLLAIFRKFSYCFVPQNIYVLFSEEDMIEMLY